MPSIATRIERLKKHFPHTGVGIMVKTEDGWNAGYAGRESKHFCSAQKAREYVSKCSTVIVIDV